MDFKWSKWNNKKENQFFSSNIANSHTMFVDNITQKIDDDLNLKIFIWKFWKVENVGVDEHLVYENFKQTISFDGERYVTALPFKPFEKPLPDNYTLSKHRLSILKTKLDKNEELKQEYNQVFDNCLKRLMAMIMGWLKKSTTCPSGSCLMW